MIVALFGWSFQASEEGGGPVVHVNVTSTNRFEVVDALTARGFVRSPILMKAYVALLVPGAKFVPRSHLLRRGLSPRELVARLSGIGSRPTVRVTFPEGWTHFQMATRLEEAEICAADGFKQAVTDQVLLSRLSLGGGSAEGYLFPATYNLKVDSDPRLLVEKFVAEALGRFAKVEAEVGRDQDLQTLQLDLRQVVTLASVVERETGIESERTRVARVFLNRLLWPDAGTSGRLQSDPTAAYGCLVQPELESCLGNGGKVTPKMLADRANAYNTYRHPGLPRGPIANPGIASFRAVLRPAKSRDLYFVTDGSGGHHFSETYPDHVKAINRGKRPPSP